MAETRYEIIVRLPMLNRQQVPIVERRLIKFVRTMGGSMSRIEREHNSDGSALHISRRKIV